MNAATDVAFNTAPPQLGAVFPQPRPQDIPNIVWKYAPLDLVMESTTEYVRNILSAMPIHGDRTHTLVDVKVQDLTPDACSCIPGWHCDSVVDPLHSSRPEHHHIFVSGHDALTEFIDGLLTLKWVPGSSLAFLQDQIPADVPIWSVPSCTIASYGRWHFHRGVVARKSHRRLLIRVTETDLVKPNRTPKCLTPSSV